MGEPNATRTVEITNPAGVHLRAASLIVGLVRRSGSRVMMIKDHARSDGSDMLEVISLGARCGDRVSFEATGDDAEEVVDALVRLVVDNFGECECKTAEADESP